MSTTPQAPGTDIFSMLGTQQQPVATTARAVQSQLNVLDAESKQGSVAKTLQELIRDSEDKLEAATAGRKVSQEDLAGIQADVLLADLASTRAGLEETRVDLGAAVVGLNELLKNIGADVYTSYGNDTPEEQALVNNARSRLARAEEEDRQASIAEGVAKSRTSWFGIRKRAIAGASARLAKAKTELEAARAGVPEAEAKAKALARTRLQNADIGASLDTYTSMSQRLEAIMMDRRAKSLEEEEFVAARRASADTVKIEATRRLREAEQLVLQLEGEVNTLTGELELIQSGTAEYASKEAQVREVNSKLEDARNQQNVALVVSDSKTRFVEELSLHEKTLQRMRGNLETWIASIRSAQEERIATFRAVLQQQKMLDDQEVAAEMDQVGAQIDQENTQFAAKALVATDRARREMLESLPGRLAKVKAVVEGLATHMAETSERDKEFIKRFHERYGLGNTVM